MRRRPTAARRVALVVPALVAVAALAGCAGGDHQPGRSGRPVTASAPDTTVPPVRLAVTGAELLAGPGAVALPEDVAAAAVGLADRWVEATTLAPLVTGSVGEGLDVLVTDAVRARLQGPDRAVLVDDGLGAGGPVRAARAEVALTGLEGAQGAVAVVVARVALDVRADDGAHVVRDGQLVLVPGGDGWLVDGYTMSVTREGGGAVTQGTATTGPAPTGPAAIPPSAATEGAT